MRMVKLNDLIKTIALMRDEYPFTDEETFVNIEQDALTRRPRLTVVWVDDDYDWEVTVSKVMRNDNNG